jgi:hypothetical protein
MEKEMPHIRQGRLSKASAGKTMPLQWLFHLHADLWDKDPCLEEMTYSPPPNLKPLMSFPSFVSLAVRMRI